MKKLLGLCCLVSAALALLSASALAGTVSKHSFYSSVLEREMVYNLYVPDSYAAGSLRYPVMYMLHGNLGTEESWIEAGNMPATLEGLVAEGKVTEQLLVVPADPKFWWADGDEESMLTAFVEDLIPHIDANHRTLAERSGRAITGYSAGGFGTVNIVLQHPELFAVAAPLSPAVYAPVPPSDSSATRQDTFVSDGEFDAERWESRNWVSFIDDYKARGIVVPFYINSGDHDRFDIAYYATVFYQALREYQPRRVELRIFDGDHDFDAWGGSIGDAMQYMTAYLKSPQ
jgi:enterochelin esterase-like enzyme